MDIKYFIEYNSFGIPLYIVSIENELYCQFGRYIGKNPTSTTRTALHEAVVSLVGLPYRIQPSC